MNKNLFELSRVVFPTLGFLEYKELFINEEKDGCEFFGELKNVTEYKFNTWMNTFAAKKYFYYCELGNIYLKIIAEGKYSIKVVGSNLNPAFDRIDEILVEQNCENEAYIQIPNIQNYEGVYFSLITANDNPATIKNISWCTDKEPQRDNKLAIVTCTFKRENYIYKNIQKFEDFISQNQDLKDKIKLIVVDNGKTIDTSRSNDMVKIIPNMNAGGAGGFTRGLMDVLENYPDFTRVLFMDDDVEIFPESFYRTLTLSNYLKDEFKDSFINGAMINLYNKGIMFENISMQEKLWLTGYMNNVDVTEYDNVLFSNNISINTFGNRQRYVSSAWWYCSFPLEFAKQNGLPMPIFFRGDDAEWSWRACGVHIISLNGICIWHAPFEWRVSKVADYYYLPRNMFFLNSIYTPNFKNKYKKYFRERAKYLSTTYDYSSFEILIRAMQDILKGSEVFKENPEEQFKEINTIAKKVNYKTCEDTAEMYWAEKPKVKWWRKIIYYMTNRGSYCPRFLYKSKTNAPELYPNVKYFRLVNRVFVYNLFTQKCEERKFNRKLSAKFTKEFKTLLKEIDKNYDKLHDEYVKAHKEFTSMKFWKEYLELV